MKAHRELGRAAVIMLTAMTLATAVADGEDDVGRPSMVSEASLPAGFPGPGPVGEVILKTYPSHRLARAAGQGVNGGCMRLFRHIERNEISMTIPEVMGWSYKPTPELTAFLFGEPTLGTVERDPAHPLVVVEDAPEPRVASIGLRGAHDESTVERGLEQLRAWLAKHPVWTEARPPWSLTYISPFVPWFAKYSEAQIPVVSRAADGDRKPE